MNVYQFDRRIQDAQHRLQKIQQETEVRDNSSEKVLEEIFAELPTALEELHIAAEKLQIQNEELIAIRAALELERKRYQELFDFAPDAYFVTNNKGIIQEANFAAEDLLKIPRRKLCGKPLNIYVAEEDRQSFHLALVQFNLNPDETNKIQDWELKILLRDATVIPCAIAISNVYNDKQEISGWRWLIRDITYRKQAEEIAQKLQEEREINHLKTRILRTVSHEFRTPMNIIHVSAQLLERYIDPHQGKTSYLFSRMRKAIERMIHLLEDILVFSQAEVGKLDYKPASIDVVSFCENLIEEIQLNTELKTIQFINRDRVKKGYWDAKLLRQILDNLLSNALKYSPPDSTIIFELDRDDERAIFRIEDNGIGIPAEDRDRIFEPFYRSPNVGTISGTGLGLAIVQKAVELHQGAIACESEVGVGTTFTVTLPL